MIKTVMNRTVEVVRERERERERESNSLGKIGFDFDAKKLIEYIKITRIDFLKVTKRLELLRESLSFL